MQQRTAVCRRNLCVLLCTLLLPILSHCEQAPAPKKFEQVNVQLQWVHQGPEAPFYVAKENGIFKEHGLDVKLMAGGPEIDPISEILSGRAQFATVATEKLLHARELDQPMTAVVMLNQRSPVTFVSLKQAAIERPKDFIGKNVTFVSTEDKVQFLAMMGKLGYPDSDIHLQPFSYSYAGLKDGSVDISGAYANGGVLRLKNQGVELNVIWPYDYGIRFYGKALIADEEFVRTHKELTRRFVQAVLKGMQKTLAEPQLALTATLKYAREQDESLQAAMIRASLPLFSPGNAKLGSINPERLRDMNRILYEQKALASPDLWQQAFTNDYLPKND